MSETATPVYRVLAEQLAQAGVRSVFGVMGEDTAPLVVAAQEKDIAWYAARHENQAVAMADGQWRVSHRVGVAAVTGGPGFTNALTAINTARRAHSGVLVITGGGRPLEDDHNPDVIRSGTPRGWLKFFPQVGVCRAIGIPVFAPATPAEAFNDLRAALTQASGGEVVVFVAGRDLLVEQVSAATLELAPSETLPPSAPADADVSLVADLLEEAWAVNRPLILAGRGAVQSGAGPALRRLGELIGAALATTLPARGLFHGDAFDVGVCGTFSTPVASGVITSANCVLAFGASLNQFTTYESTMFPNALVVNVDKDEQAVGRFVDAEASIVADARLTAEALVKELERRGHASSGLRTPALSEEIEAYDPRSEFSDQSSAARIDLRTLMAELDLRLPKDRIVAADGGRHAKFAIRFLRVTRPDNFSWCVDAGSMGLGMGLAIGAAVARPGETVVIPIGDTGIMMALGDLETAVRYKLPLIVVIANDEALGSEVNVLAGMGLPVTAAEIATPPLAEVARSLGAEAMTVRSVADLDAVSKAMAKPREVPLVLECLIDAEAAASP